MPAFLYRAVDSLGKSERGVIEATNEVAARGLLRDRKLLPLSVHASNSASPAGTTLAGSLGEKLRPGNLFRMRTGARALATITRQLSTLIGSDVRIEEALRLVARQNDAAAAGPLLLDVRSAILDGRSFASALGEHPRLFPEFYRASVAAGENAGRLPQVLEHLADFVENRHRNQQKVQLALLYPALLAAVSAALIVLLLIYVVPNIVKVFVSRGAELPFLTKGLIALSSVIQSYGWLILIAMGLLAWGARRWLKTPENRLARDRFFATRAPFARFSRQINAARFSGSLATLVQSEAPLIDALTAAAAVTPNSYIRSRALLVAARVREGTSLNQAMREAEVFPPMLVAIVASGESSGRLGRSLRKAADDLDRETEALAATVVALVEPAVLLFMGGVVLLMVLSILLPIMSLNSLARL
jgi:general secretion pathway protein F